MWRSTIKPHQLAASSSAAPTVPGSRLASGGMALNRWVKPVRPARARRAPSRSRAAVWPAATITPACRQAADVIGVHVFRRQGHRVRPAPSEVSIASPRARPAGSWRGRGCPCAPGLRNGPSIWMPSTPGHARCDRPPRGGDRLGDPGRVVADQGRQEAGGAEAPMRRADGGDALERRRVVEQHAAAAIDLDIDEARRQQPREIPAGSRLSTALAGITARMRPPSITTAWRLNSFSPSKSRSGMSTSGISLLRRY